MSEDRVVIKIREIVGRNCVLHEDGKRAHARFAKALESDAAIIELDFTGVDVITATALNFFIGDIPLHYTRKELHERVRVTNIGHHGNDLRAVIDNAFGYFEKQKLGRTNNESRKQSSF